MKNYHINEKYYFQNMQVILKEIEYCFNIGFVENIDTKEELVIDISFLSPHPIEEKFISIVDFLGGN